MILTVHARKGGVGKSTLACNLAAAWAGKGKNVLLVDTDAQGTAGAMLGIREPEMGLADVLRGALPIEHAVSATSMDRLFLLPGGEALETITQTQMHALRDGVSRFDGLVLMDTPPGRSAIATEALNAAAGILVPAVLRVADIWGVADTVNRLGDKVLGVVPSMVDRRVSATESLLGMMRDEIGHLLTPGVPISSRTADAVAYGVPVVEWDKVTRAAVAFQDIAKDIEKRCRKRGLTI